MNQEALDEMLKTLKRDLGEKDWTFGADGNVEVQAEHSSKLCRVWCNYHGLFHAGVYGMNGERLGYSNAATPLSAAAQARAAAQQVVRELNHVLQLIPSFDLHRMRAAKVFDVSEHEVTMEQRQWVKNHTFSFNYGFCFGPGGEPAKYDEEHIIEFLRRLARIAEETPDASP